MTLLLGVAPRLITDITGPAVAALLDDVHTSLPAPDEAEVLAANEGGAE